MELLVKRQVFTDKSTIGQLFVDGTLFCFTLEDYDRLSKGEAKVPGKTCIPKGRYEVKNTWSPKYSKNVPEICGVPGFQGIRIHSGNTDTDTEGCLLLGESRSVDAIGSSRIAIGRFLNIFLAAVTKKEKVYITIQ